LFNLKKTDVEWKVARDAAKVFQFGGLSYGGGDNEIYEKILIKCPRLPLTFKAFKEARTRWEAAHPAYGKWYNSLISGTGYMKKPKTRIATTFSGRKRILMGDDRDVCKQLLNTPIQGGAASIINQAMIRIDERLETSKFDSKIILQVHDELIFEYLESEFNDLKKLVKEEMEREINFNGRMVKFPVDMKWGPDWGNLKGGK
jgi:DNA polymerase I-like protein with 3'-5' exonuclease and polymerase domains